MTSPSFLGAAKTVFLGMLTAQAIPLIGSLFIARIYAPSDFGLFSTWMAIVMTAAVVVTGRFEMALGVENDGRPRRFALVSILITIIFICSILWIAVIGVYFLSSQLHNLGLGLVLMFFPATLLAAAIQTWQAFAAAEGLYRDLSIIRITQSIGVTGVQIAVGMFFPNAETLAFGYVFGVIISTCIAAYLMPIGSEFIGSWRKLKRRLGIFWLRHRNFPKFALPADFINTAAGMIPLLVITSRFGEDSSGYFALTMRVLGAPIGLLGAAVLDVFKRNSSLSYMKHGHCRDEYVNAFKLLAFGGVVLALGVIFLSEPLFVFAFGKSWQQSGTLAIWLMPLFAMRFVASPLSYVFYIAGKQHIDLMWQCALLGMTLAAFFLPTDFEDVIKAYSIGYALLYCVYLILSYRYSKGSLR